MNAARPAVQLASAVVIGEEHAFGGELVEVRRSPGHHAPVVGPDVPNANVVCHDHDDVGFLRLRCSHVAVPSVEWNLCGGCPGWPKRHVFESPADRVREAPATLAQIVDMAGSVDASVMTRTVLEPLRRVQLASAFL